MMRLFILAAMLAIPAAPAAAQHAGHGEHHASPPPADPACPPEHAAMGHCKPATAPPEPPAAPPEAACPPEHAAMGHCTPAASPPAMVPPAASDPEHAADAVWGEQAMAASRHAVHTEHGSARAGKVMLDRLEYRAKKGADGYAWEGEGWYGGDYDRLWIKTEGEGEVAGSLESAEVQALWSHALGPWFNLQTGIRYDLRPRPDRAHLAVGVQGLAPYWFEVDLAAFLSDRGDLSARMEAEYDQRITNRLILQPRIELELAAQDVRPIGVGAGLSSIETGLRLRYEVVPEFAPYIGVDYARAIGRTADFRRAAGEGTGGWGFLMGVRAWF